MKTFNKYLVLCKLRHWSEQNIIGFRKQLGMCSNLTTEQKQALLDTFNQNEEHFITEEQTKKGIDYLRKISFKKNGLPRMTKGFPFYEQQLEIIRNFEKFAFVGLVCNSMSYLQYSPIYRVYSKTGDYGDYFDYIAGSQGQIEVI